MDKILNITVKNKRTYKGVNPHYIGRPSCLGNEFTSKSYGLGKKVESVSESIRLYEIWLRNQILNKNHKVRDELVSIYEKSLEKQVDLICWCWPKPCHGDVIIKVLTEYVNRKQTKS